MCRTWMVVCPVMFPKTVVLAMFIATFVQLPQEYIGSKDNSATEDAAG